MYERISFARYDRNALSDCTFPVVAVSERENQGRAISNSPIGGLKTAAPWHRWSDTAATEFGKISRERAGPFSLVLDG
jgi:hypothetical protein